MSCLIPAAHGDDRPDRFDYAEGPRALQKSVGGAERAGASEGEDKPRAAALECVCDEHGGDGEESEDG